MNGVYAVSLMISAACLVLLDIRFDLVFRRKPLAAGLALAIGIVFFVVWDAVGISLGVFHHIDSRWATGVLLAPAFPLEEIMFLGFLSYLTLILLSGWRRWRDSRETTR
ncbi:C50 carotenoid epsilon cyclase [Microbacterium sp. CH12i]|uniref:lycopene cyclase domain-containing protein n=1 Tax=Microbacterium sp. CH12i TaxID=1479651 RepID=UPI000460FD82|nr:lycopene cyclase domain-containing protein [Microbacterium sp. CH12i]KDA05621.1 C50 carotenoid epsilon cyclase [Microbacterium sp. CH12i]